MFLEAFELGLRFYESLPEGGRSRIERIIQRIPTPTSKKAEDRLGVPTGSPLASLPW
jgi:hypothetical protein